MTVYRDVAFSLVLVRTSMFYTKEIMLVLEKPQIIIVLTVKPALGSLAPLPH